MATHLPEDDLVVSHVRTRGRPQRLPLDAGSWHTPTVDVTARTAWLLATSRLLSPATRGVPREEFIRRARADGVTADPTRVSRWELGSVTAGSAVIDGYERLTERPAGCFTAARLLMTRHTDRPVREQEPSPPTFDLDQALTDLATTPPDGGGWLGLSAALSRYERLYLDPTTWERIGDRLIAELALSSGIAHTTRLAAASLLIRHPGGRRHLTLSVGRFATAPAVQYVTPALDLLRDVDDPAAGELVLRLMSDDNRLLRHAAATAAPGLHQAGRFPEHADRFLEQLAGTEAARTGNLARRVAALDLLSHLPPAVQDRILANVKDERSRRQLSAAVAHLELVDARHARSVCESLGAAVEAAAGRANADPDRMLRVLLREALFHVRAERRQLAGCLLATSLYARPLARQLLALVSPDDVTAAMRWSLLGQLGHVVDRQEVAAMAVAEPRDSLRSRAWLALGFARGDLDDDAAGFLCQLVERPEARRVERHAALFALGMSRHPRLGGLDASSTPGVAKAAAWWSAMADRVRPSS